ncbi:MAG: alpha/beta hydrolase [Myxococcales bacterium]|nr:alpha/beta hydrolase [Myxococcales bacterium]
MSSQPEELTIQTHALRLAARAWGPPDGVPVLALHGWLDNAASFDTLAPRLPGLRLVCLDMPGHGHSEHAAPGELYGFVDTVARVAEVPRVLGWARYCLLGHSLGAAVASVLAGTFPRQVRRLVLVEGLGPMVEAPEQAPARLARSITEQLARRGRPAPRYASAEEAAERLRRAVGTLSAEGARALVGRGLCAVEGGVTWRSDPRLRVASRLRLTEAQVLAFLRAVEAPTLLVRGAQGYPETPALHQRLAAVRDIATVTLPGGHHVHLDAPEPVAEAIAAFLAPEHAGPG